MGFSETSDKVASLRRNYPCQVQGVRKKFHSQPQRAPPAQNIWNQSIASYLRWQEKSASTLFCPEYYVKPISCKAYVCLDTLRSTRNMPSLSQNKLRHYQKSGECSHFGVIHHPNQPTPQDTGSLQMKVLRQDHKLILFEGRSYALTAFTISLMERSAVSTGT